MSLSPAGYPANLDPSNPKGTDPGSILDDQDRNILQSIKQTFPNVDAAVTATPAQLNSSGYGGIYLSTPFVGTLPLTSTPVKVDTYDSNKTPSPVGVTQDFSNGQITLTAGLWHMMSMFSGVLTADATTDPRHINFRIYTSTGTQTELITIEPVPRYSISGNGTISGLLRLTGTTILELRAYTSPGDTVEITSVNYIELSAHRVGPA